MAEKPVRVLLVDDDDDDFFLVEELFNELPAESYQLDRVADYAAAVRAFEQREHDVYLVDYRLGAHSGIELIREAKRLGTRAPIIVLTGQVDRETDLLAMRAGAVDYLTKDRLDSSLLDRAIRYALQQRRHEAEIRETNLQLERRVAERTAELAALNEALQQEIAERKRVEEALREADSRKDEFIAMLAHELRNPLSPVVAALDLMKEPSPDIDPAELRDIMARQVSQLVRLVDDLLDVSRVSRGKMQVRKERIPLYVVIQGAIDVSQPLIDAARHELSVALAPEQLYLHGDRVRLTQVVGNLLINAAKYTPPEGKISLTVERQGNQALIRVTDNGIGIPPDMLPKVFDLFQQADAASTRAHGGLGIGLTLAKTLVEMHGGSISVRSEGTGKGSEFSVSLPLVDAPANADRHAVPHNAALNAFRVLIVDDNRAAVFLLQRLLQKLGQDVQVEGDPRLALKSAHELRPQVIISDIAMPEMSGYDLARELRALPLEPRPILVALTGYGQDRDRDAAREAGFDFHLTKPAGLKELQHLFAALSSER
jgi:signal transduction histidine kinase